MYNLPQEIEVWYIIPAIRRDLAISLVKKHDLSMEDAGNILGVSKAAISQYIGKKRATQMKFPLSIKKEIIKSAAILIKNKELGPSQILKLLDIIKKRGCGCRVCKRYNKGILKLCKSKQTCR